MSWAVVNLGSGRTAKAISAGYQHTCAILDDDTLKCLGYNQMYGAVGVGSSDKYVWDPTEVKFDGSSSSGGSGCARPLGPERYVRSARHVRSARLRWPER